MGVGGEGARGSSLFLNYDFLATDEGISDAEATGNYQGDTSSLSYHPNISLTL